MDAWTIDGGEKGLGQGLSTCTVRSLDPALYLLLLLAQYYKKGMFYRMTLFLSVPQRES